MKGFQSFSALSLLLVFVLWGGWLHCSVVADHHDLGCRTFRFPKPVDGFALQGHVIKNISVNMETDDVRFECRVLCGGESTCVSINIGPPGNDGVSLCQLSNSDHIRHPDDLKPHEGFLYWATQNPCNSDPCLHNATCLSGFTDKGYVCLCQAGYTGEYCEPALYNFTTLGASGKNGPDSNAGYVRTGLQDVQVRDGKQNWRVPFTGRFRVEACGASGGQGSYGRAGGKGAKVNGYVTLAKGAKLVVLVGQRGYSQSQYHSGSGGGGTFVVYFSGSPFLVAGGGGGGTFQDGFPGNDHVNGSGTNGAGSNGDGGFVCEHSDPSFLPDSGSGAGIHGNGGCFESGKSCGKILCDKGGQSFIDGGQGGEQSNCPGGFGGGGACGTFPGGGGGYSGGGVDANTAGGGGGSFVDVVTLSIIKGGCNEGDGYVSFITVD
ncbi:hypothetical protein ACROYT_G032427 [Oculina patagonica]